MSASIFFSPYFQLLVEPTQDWRSDIAGQRIQLAHLPKVFEGFRIAQLSDVRLSPFATADYIRRCVAITNGLNPDLVVLTRDYICWNPQAEGEAV